MNLLHPWNLLWLALAVLPGLLWYYQHLRTQNTALALGLNRLPGSLMRLGLAVAAWGLFALALSGPVTEAKTESRSTPTRDLVVAVDVSKSMLAADLVPNRLERAKLGLEDLVRALEGDRVALVAFAGTSVLRVPLTTDYGFFLSSVKEMSPQASARGGTLLGDALRKIRATVLPGEKRQATILLITDGGDQDSFPLEAARPLAEAGIRLVILGLGNVDGAPIVLPDGSKLTYEGQEIRSGLNRDLLKSLAAATPGGVYIEAGTKAFDLEALYRSLRQSGFGQNGEVQVKIQAEWYQIPAFLGFLCLAGLWFFPGRLGKAGPK